MRKTILFLLGAMLLPGIKAATITIDSPAAVSGFPGAAVTWDFTIHNDTDYWVIVASAEFPAGSTLGLFEDFMATFPYLAPHTNQAGTVQFTINAGAAPSASASGPINVNYFEYNVDLLAWTGDDPPAPIGPAQVIFANVTVTVDEVPEPATFLLVAGALLLLRVKRPRRV